ncbi:hypothetical protein JW865_05950 [Candidatus Bathyarchaeota archaeon]|nr:hypothetical protein [Candidatus Bathyarchaeota archaeon]
MKPLKLVHIKEEIRVLGIAVSEYNYSFHVIGIIFRGKKFLESVFQFKTDNKLEKTIIQSIRDTSKNKQIRTILLHYKTLPKNLHINILEIYNETGIPIIYILKETPSLMKIDWKKIEDYSSIQFYGIKKQVVQKILKMVTQKENIPEVLRIGYILLESNLKKVA